MNPKIATRRVSLLLLLFALCAGTALAQAQQPTSQVLTFNGSIPGQPDGPVDLRLRLYDASTSGTLLFEETQTVNVSAEKFTVLIGNATGGGVPTSVFQSNPSLWIALALDATPDSEIGSRAAITSSGYAHLAALATSATTATTATTATDATQLGGVAASQYVQTTDARLSDARTPTAGSSNYIQANPPAQQANASFNISGNGSVSGTLFGSGIGTFVGVEGDVTTGNGVQGISTNGIGVFGRSTSGIGVVANTPQGSVGNVSLRTNGTSWFSGDTTPLTSAYTLSGTGIAIGSSGNLGYIFAIDYSEGGATKTLALNSPGGNVGIGTSSPQTTLQVKTAPNNYGFTHTDGAITFGSFVGGTTAPIGGWFGTKSNHPLYLFTGDDVARLAITTGGSVGIGTPAPKAKLDVTGGNILVGSPGQGIILKSPDGATCKLLSIDNTGAMALSAIACP